MVGGTRDLPTGNAAHGLEELGEGAILGQVATRAAAEPLGEHTLVALVGEHDDATLGCVVSQHAARGAPGEPRQAGAEQDDGRPGFEPPGRQPSAASSASPTTTRSGSRSMPSRSISR